MSNILNPSGKVTILLVTSTGDTVMQSLDVSLNKEGKIPIKHIKTALKVDVCVV